MPAGLSVAVAGQPPELLNAALRACWRMTQARVEATLVRRPTFHKAPRATDGRHAQAASLIALQVALVMASDVMKLRGMQEPSRPD